MNKSEGISLTEQQRYWLKHIRACEASGKHITEYATENGLGVRAMSAASERWSRKMCYPARMQHGFSAPR